MTIPSDATGKHPAKKTFGAGKCGEASGLGKGQLVRRAFASEETDSTAEAVTIKLCSSPDHVPCGVVTKKVKNTERVTFQKTGWCDYLNTDGNVNEGDWLYPSDLSLPGVCTGCKPHLLHDLGYEVRPQAFFGHALDDDSSGTLTYAMLWCMG